MAGHTKGPWTVEVGTHHLWVGPPKAAGGKIGDVVVSVDYGPGYSQEVYERQAANARLIAAAPDLLEAAKDFVRKVDAGEARSTKSYAAFKAAIAKAEQSA